MAINVSLPEDKMTIMRGDIGEGLEALRFRPGGVYVFYDEDGVCLYVGQSKSLADRIRTHLSSSPFSEEIASVTVYFVSDPYEREIYETYAITTFNGRHNRAKKFDQRSANPTLQEEIDETYYEINDLIRERWEHEDAIRDIDETYYRKPPRKWNKFTGDFTQRYLEYLDELDRETEADRIEHRRALRERARLAERIVEIDREIQIIREKRRRLFQKLAI